MGWFKKIFSPVEKPKPVQVPAPPPAAGANASPAEVANSKKMDEKRKEREKIEKAAEDMKLVIDGAKLQCTLCTNPMGTLKVIVPRPTIEGKPTATVKDKGKMNVLFTGTCSKSPNAASPCAAVMQLGEWQDTGSLKVQDESPLLLKSTIKCMFGGVDIKVMHCGQMNAM